MRIFKSFNMIIVSLLIIMASVFVAGTKSEAKTLKVTMYVDQHLILDDYFKRDYVYESYVSISKNKLVKLEGPRAGHKEWLTGKKVGKTTIKLYTYNEKTKKKKVNKIKLTVKKSPIEYELQSMPKYLGRYNTTLKITNNTNRYVLVDYYYRFYDSDGAFKADKKFLLELVPPKHTIC